MEQNQRKPKGRTRYSTQESIVKELKRRNRNHLKLNAQAVIKDDRPLYRQGTNRFGCWKNAIEAAGISYAKIAEALPSPYPTETSVLIEIRRRKRKKKRLNVSAVLEEDRPLYRKAGKVFGSWEKAIEAAGFDYQKIALLHPFPLLSYEDVLAEIRQRGKRKQPLLAKELRSGSYAERSLYNLTSRKFGGWVNAVEAAGLKYPTVRHSSRSCYPTKDSVIKEIQSRKTKGLPLTTTTVQRGPTQNPALIQQGYSLFKSWQNAVEAAGINYPVQHPYPTKKSIIKEIQRRRKASLPLDVTSLIKGAGEQVDSALYSKGLKIFGSWSNALRNAGVKPHLVARSVHSSHVTKKMILKGIKDRHKKKLSFGTRILYTENHSLICQAKRQFGSWQAAVEAAGLNYSELSSRYRYPTRDAVIQGIIERINNEQPVSFTALISGTFPNTTLYNSGKRLFGGQWTYAVAVAWIQSSKIGRIALRTDLEPLILRQINRRANEGLSLVSDELMEGLEEEVALVKAAIGIFRHWPAALRAADVAWDGKGVAKFGRIKSQKRKR